MAYKRSFTDRSTRAFYPKTRTENRLARKGPVHFPSVRFIYWVYLPDEPQRVRLTLLLPVKTFTLQFILETWIKLLL